MVWEIFGKKLQKAIEKRGFGSPTDIQKKGIPPIHAGEDTLLIAPTGLGKCVSGDTVIFTNNGPVEIRNLYRKKMFVDTMDVNYKTTRKVGYVVKKKKSELFELKTSSGRSVKVTDDHKFFSLEKDGPCWKELKNLSIGDYIAIPRKISVRQSYPQITLEVIKEGKNRLTVATSPSFSDIVETVKRKRNGIGLRVIARRLGVSRAVLMGGKKGHRIDIKIVKKLAKFAKIDLSSISVTEAGIMGGKPIRIRLNKDFSYFMGLFAGDGNFNQGRTIRFSTASGELLKRFSGFCDEIGLKVKKDKSHDYDYYTSSQTLVTLLKSVGFPLKNKSANIDIPKILFQNKGLLSSFLRGIYDTDGSIYGVIELLSKSRNLINSVSHGLLFFGIMSRIKEKKVKGNIYYRLFIENSENFRKFEKHIGFNVQKKKERLGLAVRMNSNPNLDIIPNLSAIIRSCKKYMNVPYSRHRMYRILESYMYGKRNPSRNGLIGLLKFLQRYSKQKSKEFILLEKLSKSDIYWDKITEINKAGTDWVYDATVPETHNFIGNGIVLHNTETCLLPLFDKLVGSENESEKHEDGKDNTNKQYKPISILYITPLKSLNRDLLKRILWWANELGFEVSVRHGDTSQYERGMQAENPPHVMISTPETLQAVLVGSRMRKHLGNIRHIVVDEVHELVDGKRGVQLSIGLERLKEAIKEKGNKDPQIIGISATIGSPDRVASYLTGEKPCKIVNAMNLRKMNLRVESPRPSARDRDMSSKMFMGPSTTARLRRIESLIKERQSVLAFTNTRESAEILSSRLRVLDPELRIETHHSSLSKNVRIEAEEQFKNGELKSLVCTSSLELGIDIGLIDFILQYMSPRQVAKLTQRIGRSGHTVSGISDGVIIAAEPDDCFESTAIASHAISGKIEPTRVYGKSLDVLGHQIVGLSMDEYMIPYEKAFRIVKRAWPFSGLTEPEFLETCMLMQRLGFIWLNDEQNPPAPGKASVVDKKTAKTDIVIKRRRKAWEYYYGNLSTIPDTKNYQVIDVVSNQPVGSLDAEFMALHGSPGTSFIVKGRSWRILEVLRNKIMVEPMAGIEAAIPAWEGELIPIPKDVAQDVGRMRREIAELIGKKTTRPRVLEYLTEKYPVDKQAAGKMYKQVKAQKDFGFVPDDTNLIMEYQSTEGELNIVIHSCFGSLTNDTIGRVLSSLLITKFGSVGLQTDPYRIMLKMQHGSVKDVKEMIEKLNPDMLEAIIRLTLPNTELYRWRFLHVCQRLGIISRDANFGPGYLKKIIESYKKQTPNHEALHEVMEEKLDIEGAKEFTGLLKSGKLKVKVMPGLSPIGEAGIAHRYEIVAPKKPDLEVFKVFKDRITNTRVRLLCTNCGTGITYAVKDLPKTLHCVNCQSKLLAVTGAKNMDAELLLNRYLKKARREKTAFGNQQKPSSQPVEFTKDEQDYLDRLADSASLVAASGHRAVIAQAGRGIGPRTAARILRRQSDKNELLKDILREEQIYARNKRFWRE